MNSNQKIKTRTEVVENYNSWTGEQLVKKMGAAYISGRDVKDIAKDVRSLIRNAVKAGLLPEGLKASVKIERYSMGCSLNVSITKVEECIINVDAWRVQIENNFSGSWADLGGQWSDRGREVLELIKQFVSAFQRSESHSQSDYHNTNFFGDVNFSSQVKNSQVEELVESDKRTNN